ncbi:FAD/NAD(P)-binding domain-containing protein [Phlegmacium glaucopus]|nr:FAD/NAD(P)-binding domain-containing protein [Phlegmacium glaucopus]
MSHSSSTDILRESVGIIGAGVSGLICAHVLLQDRFTDVTLISRDKSVGGTWMRDRVYHGLYINNVHGEYRFSSMHMPPPQDSTIDNGHRLSGIDLCDYMENFAENFLIGTAKFKMETEVLNIERDEKGKWKITIEDLLDGSFSILTFSRIILATGGCSAPSIPSSLSQEAADKASFRGLVIHSSDFGSHLDEILDTVKPVSKDENETILVVGGGKSAQDIAAKLTNEGRKVVMVSKTIGGFIARSTPAPAFIRKSRLLPILTPHSTLNTRIERFFHTTTIGSAIVRYIWNKVEQSSFTAYGVPVDSVLRRTPYPLFWSIRSSDVGAVRPDSFQALALTGKIKIIAPAHALGYSNDGKCVILSNGQEISAKAVILATGYQSSWSNVFSPEMAEEIGIAKHSPKTHVKTKWNYKSLKHRPTEAPEHGRDNWVLSIYRGLVPAKNIEKRDFAIAGAFAVTNFSYTAEVAAHWISSYFQGDKTLKVPSPEEATAKAEEHAAWLRIRFPHILPWTNPSWLAGVYTYGWPQAVEELLQDMSLPIYRSGGNWFNWIFQVIDSKEIANLSEERRVNREASYPLLD